MRGAALPTSTLEGVHSLPAEAQVAFFWTRPGTIRTVAQGARADGVRDALEAVARDFALRASGARIKKRA
jgi:hypothetical protein